MSAIQMKSYEFSSTTTFEMLRRIVGLKKKLRIGKHIQWMCLQMYLQKQQKLFQWENLLKGYE
jgi:hypothetical protein